MDDDGDGEDEGEGCCCLFMMRRGNEMGQSGHLAKVETKAHLLSPAVAEALSRAFADALQRAARVRGRLRLLVSEARAATRYTPPLRLDIISASAWVRVEQARIVAVISPSAS